MLPNIEELVKYHKPENFLIFSKFRPLHRIMYIGYIDWDDEPSLTPCIIDESTYKVADGHKITLNPMYKNFSPETYYLEDFNSLWHSGEIKVFIEVK